jgi:hypothetical protein
MLLSGATSESIAQTAVDRSFDPSPRDCADVRWSQAALRSFPEIASACRAVETRNGKAYVRLDGDVESVPGDGKRIRVDFDHGGELIFKPTPNTVLYIDGERTPFAQVEDGMNLKFYIPEDRLHAELQPDPARLAFVIVPLDFAVAARDQPTLAAERARERGTMRASASAGMSELPATAGPLPWIALGAGALLVSGAAATLARVLRR